MREVEEIRQVILAGHHDQAWALYQIHCVTARKVSGEAHYLGGRAAMLAGNLYGAQRAFERALETGIVGEPLGRVRLLLGEALRRIGSLADAAEVLERYLAEEEKYPKLGAMWRAGAYINLGLTYRQQRRLDGARDAYQAAAVECRREGLRLWLGYSLRNLAWVCCLLGDAEGARVALDEADGFCDGDGDRWHQVLGKAFESAVRGDRQHSMGLCQQVLGGENVPADVMAQTAWLLGRDALAHGDYANAESFADQAVEMGMRCSADTRVMLDGAELLREVRCRRRDAENTAAGA